MLLYKLQDINGILVLVVPRLGNVFLTLNKPDVYNAQFYEHAERQFYFQRDKNKNISGFILSGDRGIVFEKLKSKIKNNDLIKINTITVKLILL